MFIAIEGLDGVGKTTLVREMARHCGGIAMGTPGVALRPVVHQVLEALGEHQTARCLFYAATVLAAGQKAHQLSEAGHKVFMDRYWLSTIAYARARGVTTDLTELEMIVQAPDLTVLITLDEAERHRRIKNRASDRYDIETLSSEFATAVLNEMRSKTRRLDLQPTEVNVTGVDNDTAMRRVLDEISRVMLPS